jgi:UDP-glucose 4-epimerase
MKAMITGGAGFIGLHLAHLLLENGIEVDLVDNFSRGVEDKDLENILSNEKCNLIKINLLEEDTLKKLGNGYNYIFHLAAIIGVKHVLNKPYEVLIQNVKLLENVLALAKRQAKLKRFLFASTSEIYAGTLKYGDLEVPTPENSSLVLTKLNESRTTYLLSKIYGEAMCNHAGVPFSIFRPHNFYGPRMGMSHVIPELLKKAYTFGTNDEIVAFSANHSRTFCYIEDAVSMIWEIAKSEKCLGEAFNIGSQGPEIKIIELAQQIVSTVGRDVKVVEGEETPGSPARRCPKMTKVEDFIGFRAKWTLDEGIRRTFSWYKEKVFEGDGVTAK